MGGNDPFRVREAQHHVTLTDSWANDAAAYLNARKKDGIIKEKGEEARVCACTYTCARACMRRPVCRRRRGRQVGGGGGGGRSRQRQVKSRLAGRRERNRARSRGNKRTFRAFLR